MNAQAIFRSVACLSLICLALSVAACSPSDTAKVPVNVTKPDIGTIDDTPITQPDVPGIDGEQGDGTGDSPATDVKTCEWPASPLSGESGAACKTSNDCNSGQCIDSAGGKICTQTCTDCCPGGMLCLQLNDGDPTNYCLPSTVNLCRPCAVDDDCTANNKKSLCLSYGDSGNFCGAPCAVDADCANGYACKDEKGSAGAGKQCRLKTGECACSKLAIEQVASTTCANTNSAGSCKGKRQCLAGGLSKCDGPAAVPETCNNLDDDCNGITDDPNAAGCTPYWLDTDKDGFGLAAPLGGKSECLC